MGQGVRRVPQGLDGGCVTVTGLDATIARALSGYDAHAVIAALQAELDRRDTAQTGGE